MLKKILATALLAFGLIFLPIHQTVQADVGDDDFDVFEILKVDEDSGVGSSTFAENIKEYADKYTDGNIVIALMMRVINILLLLIGTFAFLVFFYAGFILVTSNGDEGKIEKGKGMIMPAILGLVFAFLAYYIASFVQSFFY
jgi:Type IV secretion system pilin